MRGTWVRSWCARCALCVGVGCYAGCATTGTMSCPSGATCPISAERALVVGLVGGGVGGLIGLIIALVRRSARGPQPSGAEARRAAPTRDTCTLPSASVRVCESSRGYRFAIPAEGACAAGSRTLGTLPLTCDAMDRPAYHACLDDRGGWISIRSWEGCAARRMADAPGDFVPPGREPEQGVAPDGIAPRARAVPVASSGGAASDVPARPAVLAALTEVQRRAAACLPQGVFPVRLVYASGGALTRVEPAGAPLDAAVLTCLHEHASAVPLPAFARAEFSVVFPMTRP